MSQVAVDNISFRYHRGSGPALSSVSLRVESGELLCLVGPSGCGKTTLLKIVSGLLRPEAGTVRFDERDMAAVPPERRKAALVFQNHMLFPFMTVLDNIASGLRMQGMEPRERSERARAMLEHR